jgi:hypothetical protein
MSVVLEHPNAREARQLRRAEIEHAMRCLYRDHTWIDPDGDLPVGTWLLRIHYMDRHLNTMREWLRNANIDSLTPVGELKRYERTRLMWQMIDFLRGER